jgi:hypothetical protein
MSDLRKFAEDAVQIWEGQEVWYHVDYLSGPVAMGNRDAPFIAAASPSVVLGLLDALEKVRALADEFAKREAQYRQAEYSQYKEGLRDAYDVAESMLREVLND